MKSGPSTEVPPLTIAPKEKDYDAELQLQKAQIQKQIEALNNQMNANQSVVSNFNNID